MTETAPRTENMPVATPDNAARNKLVITVLLISAFVVILNETIMGVAIPHLITDLGIDASAAQWLSTAFMLTMSVVIPITGFLLQRFNTRPIFIAAMALFSLGTLIAIIAPGFEVLLVARVVQASGTAIMMPLLFTTVLNLVEPSQRGRVIGNVSIVISVAPAIGPTISGIILNYLDWRWMFIVVLPISLAALVVGSRLMVNVTEPTSTRVDVFSVVLSVLGFGGLVYGIVNMGTVVGTVSIVVGVLGIVAFVLRQLSLQKTDAALLDLRTFLSPIFTVSIATTAISMSALFGTIILLPIYMQTVLHLEPLVTGLLLLPGGLIMGLLAPFVGRIYDKRGPRVLLIPGSIIVSLALWGMTMFTATSPIWGVLVAHVTLSVGLALLFTPLFTSGLASLAPNLYSHGSAVLGTVQQLAGAAGTALFVGIMATVAATLAGGGESIEVATATGITNALRVGAIISLVAIPAVFFIRAAPQGSDAPPVH